MRFRRILTLSTAIALAAPAFAETDSGSYLAARSAIIANEYALAADYYARALARDPGNLELMDGAVTSYVGAGDVARAVPIARRMVQTGDQSQISALSCDRFNRVDGFMTQCRVGLGMQTRSSPRAVRPDVFREVSNGIGNRQQWSW